MLCVLVLTHSPSSGINSRHDSSVGIVDVLIKQDVQRNHRSAIAKAIDAHEHTIEVITGRMSAGLMDLINFVTPKFLLFW